MRDIPDDARLTTLSIPGTHNSCCVDGLLGLARTQNLDLPEQLEAGIRFLDIRFARYQDELCAHHDVVCAGKSYEDVLTVCAEFLRQRPSETILLSVKEESVFDSVLGELAPSRVLCKLSTMGTKDGDDRNHRFEDLFKMKTWRHIGDASLFYNFAAGTPGSGSAGASAVTSETSIGELRGKIVLLRRFEAGQEVGLDLTYWPENQRFRSATPPFYDIEDRYQNPGEDDKFDFVTTHMEEARRGDPEDLYITFSSAVDLTAHSYSRAINPRLDDHLAASSRGRIGIIVMDYFEEPQELTSRVIHMNPTAERPPEAPEER